MACARYMMFEQAYCVHNGAAPGVHAHAHAHAHVHVHACAWYVRMVSAWICMVCAWHMHGVRAARCACACVHIRVRVCLSRRGWRGSSSRASPGSTPCARHGPFGPPRQASWPRLAEAGQGWPTLGAAPGILLRWSSRLGPLGPGSSG